MAAAAAAVLSVFLLLLPLFPPAFSDDTASLLKLKASFGNADSTPLKSWSASSPDPPCKWTGVACFAGIITRLRLGGMGLNGTVDVDALSHLKSLRSISLNDNGLSGPVPDLGRLDALKSIYLSNNNFSGAIADDFFAQMDHLKKLWLEGNGLSGSIPSSLSKATSLIELHLDSNRFSGAIPEFNIPSLRTFNVSGNAGLTGPIPAPLARFGAGSFLGIPGLCGAPLRPCGAPPEPAEAPATAGPRAEADSTPPPPAPEESQGNGGTVSIVVALVLTVLIVLGLVAKKQRHEVAPFHAMEEDSADAMEAAAAAESGVFPSPKQSGTTHKRTASSQAGTGSARSGAGGGAAELVMVNEEKGTFQLSDLMKASAEVLGNGGLGSAYKAVMANGVSVAVKRMRELNRVGKDVFDAEMRRFGRLKHRNVLTPLAYHYRKEEKLVVSEFVSRGSLLYLLHGDRGAEHAALDWPTRLKIIRGIVQGVAYLHAELTSVDVPHGNLKSGNILLNHEFEPLLVDYGFVSLVNPSQASSVLFAYKSPEAVQHCHVCPKSDVYCLGIVILEILTGKFPSQYLNNTKGGTDVAQWSVSAIAEGREAELLDPDIAGAARDSVGDMVRLLKLGVECAREELEQRPTMKELAVMVEEIATGSAGGETATTTSQPVEAALTRNGKSFKDAYEES